MKHVMIPLPKKCIFKPIKKWHEQMMPIKVQIKNDEAQL